MSRWPPDAAGRLKAAALKLFAERGFASVKGAEIAAEAGVSERTFFRHFRAKEDVLFEDYSGVREAMVELIAAPPQEVCAREIMQRLADFLSERFALHRDEHRFLNEVLAREPILKAREVVRDRDWANAIAEGFQRRGFSSLRAELLSAVIVATFRAAHRAWLNDQDPQTPASRFAEAIEILSMDLG